MSTFQQTITELCKEKEIPVAIQMLWHYYKNYTVIRTTKPTKELVCFGLLIKGLSKNQKGEPVWQTTVRNILEDAAIDLVEKKIYSTKEDFYSFISTPYKNAFQTPGEHNLFLGIFNETISRAMIKNRDLIFA